MNNDITDINNISGVWQYNGRKELEKDIRKKKKKKADNPDLQNEEIEEDVKIERNENLKEDETEKKYGQNYDEPGHIVDVDL